MGETRSVSRRVSNCCASQGHVCCGHQNCHAVLSVTSQVEVVGIMATFNWISSSLAREQWRGDSRESRTVRNSPRDGAFSSCDQLLSLIALLLEDPLQQRLLSFGHKSPAKSHLMVSMLSSDGQWTMKASDDFSVSILEAEGLMKKLKVQVHSCSISDPFSMFLNSSFAAFNSFSSVKASNPVTAKAFPALSAAI